MIEKFDEFGIHIELHWPIGWVESWLLHLFDDGYEGDLNAFTRSLMEAISPNDHHLRVIRDTWRIVDEDFGHDGVTGWIDLKCGGFDRTALLALFESLSRPIIASWEQADLEECGDADEIERLAREFLVQGNPMAEKRRITLRHRLAHEDGPPWLFEYRLWKPGRPRYESLDFEVVVHDHLGLLRHWTLLTP